MKLWLAPLLLVAGVASARPGSIVRVEHHDPNALPSRGPRSAPVTVELFFTPVAGANQRYKQVLELQAAHPTRVRVVFRVIVGGAQAMLPNAVLEAQAQGKFDELMAELAAARSGGLPRPQLLELGKKVGLDPDRLLAAILENRYKPVLDANFNRMKRRVPRGLTAPIILFNGAVPRTALGDARNIEAEYKDALARAEELVDRGADPRTLARAFDALADDEAAARDVKITPGQVDDDSEGWPSAPRLAAPPFDLTNLPSVGPTDAATTIIIACKPTSANCVAPLHVARQIQEMYADRVRLVWAPYFDVASDDAPDHTLLADAALCAERVGVAAALDLDPIASPGYVWVDQMLGEWQRRRGRHQTATELVDQLSEKLRADPRELAACRARHAGASVEWIEHARRAGLKASPATIVGGRIYGPINDAGVLQTLVAAELAGGDLDWLQRNIGLDRWRRTK
jgi:hypothetical protein